MSSRPSSLRCAALAAVLAVAACTATPHRAAAQPARTQSSGTAEAATLPPAPSATPRPLVLMPGVAIEREQPGTLALTLDGAIATALEHNTELVVRTEQQNFIGGQTLSAVNALLPNLSVSAYTQAQEINLAAMGFKPGSIRIPGFNGAIPTIVKVNTTDAQLNLSQQLTVPAYFLYRGARSAAEANQWATLSARGGVVLNVGGLYLRTLADQAQVRDAEALVRQDTVVLDHARAAQQAGTGIHLDTLRAQVTLAQEKQTLVAAENAVAKDKLQLNRLMGQPAGQALDLVDAAPFAELEAMPLDAALRTAYENRKDLRGLEAQLDVAHRAAQAVRAERLPTLAINGFYGVLGETTGLYHGVFAATGRVAVPVFYEAALRGQKEVAQAQILGLQHQIDARRATIESDLRASMLDVESARRLVEVARSNVALSQQALSDSVDRFTAGVDDNLPVVRAQAALVNAEARVIQAEFQFNFSKLQLARNTGVVETEYRHYLGK